jgi:hypothetical protein
MLWSRPLPDQARLSEAQRQQQLFGGGDGKAKGLASGCPTEARGLGSRPRHPLGVRLAGMLQAAAEKHLSAPPSSAPGAARSSCT